MKKKHIVKETHPGAMPEIQLQKVDHRKKLIEKVTKIQFDEVRDAVKY